MEILNKRARFDYFVEEELDSYEYELTKEEFEGVNNG